MRNRRRGQTAFIPEASINNLANAECENGQFDEALIHIRRALLIFESKLGEDSIEYAYVCRTAGKVYQGKADYAAALEYEENALRLFLLQAGTHEEEIEETRQLIAEITSSMDEDG